MTISNSSRLLLDLSIYRNSNNTAKRNNNYYNSEIYLPPHSIISTIVWIPMTRTVFGLMLNSSGGKDHRRHGVSPLMTTAIAHALPLEPLWNLLPIPVVWVGQLVIFMRLVKLSIHGPHDHCLKFSIELPKLFHPSLPKSTSMTLPLPFVLHPTWLLLKLTTVMMLSCHHQMYHLSDHQNYHLLSIFYKLFNNKIRVILVHPVPPLQKRNKKQVLQH